MTLFTPGSSWFQESTSCSVPVGKWTSATIVGPILGAGKSFSFAHPINGPAILFAALFQTVTAFVGGASTMLALGTNSSNSSESILANAGVATNPWGIVGFYGIEQSQLRSIPVYVSSGTSLGQLYVTKTGSNVNAGSMHVYINYLQLT